MLKRLRIVTLLSDFGTRDAYVASMKAAVLKACPDARLIDITHHVPRHDVQCGSITLERAIDGFPAGSVHLAVVDPGVGTDRRILVVEIANQRVICPDNGLITWAWRRHPGGRAYELTWRPAKHSSTFHGRDIMAPAAANPTTERVKALFDDPALATMRTARATFPGDFTITFQEFTGVDRKPVRHRVQDPGGPILLVNVSDFQAAVAAVAANGGTVGDGETSVMPAANATSAWVRDPNGVLIRLSPPAQPRRGGATQ